MITQITIRFDAAAGSFASASITRPDGTQEASVADVINEIPALNSAALARIGELEAERDQARADAAEVASLRAQIEQLTPKPGQLSDQLEAAFEALPEAVQTAFVIPAGVVGFYVQRGNLTLARLALASMQVPEELEETKAQFVALLGGDAKE